MQVHCQDKKLLEWRLPGLLKAIHFIGFGEIGEVPEDHRLRKVAVRFSNMGTKSEQYEIVCHQKSHQDPCWH